VKEHPQQTSGSSLGRLRRDLGSIESYATVIGILIGAGIFQVTSTAWSLTGPSVILGYLALTPAILATSIPYAAFLSTPLGTEPGGEYLHISRSLSGFRLAYIGAWLKIISYVGAGAYLANAFAGYVIALSGGRLNPETYQLPLALASLVFFWLIHVIGIRWFGRFQVVMSALKLLALLVLIVPGLFVVHLSNYKPFFTHGVSGFAVSLLPLFFAYAGFESIAQTAGEVKDSTKRLPGILLKAITITALIYVFTSIVSFGVLPAGRIQSNSAPMAEVASIYLPGVAAIFVTVGAIAAIMTALNGTMFVPSRLAMMFVHDGLAPKWLGFVNDNTGTPIRGLTLTLLCCIVLLVSGQLSLALNIAVFALVVLYFIHSLIFVFLPRLNPALERDITIAIPRWLLKTAAVLSVVSMGLLILIQLSQDFAVLSSQTLSQRIAKHTLTSIELMAVWAVIGAVLYWLARLSSSKPQGIENISEIERVDANGD
jgi:APA family basic amino acid/polyamine antiporter